VYTENGDNIATSYSNNKLPYTTSAGTTVAPDGYYADTITPSSWYYLSHSTWYSAGICK